MAWRSRRRVCHSGSEDPGEAKPDIDSLAQQLAKQAAKLRASMTEEDVAEMITAEEREQVVYQNIAPKLPGATATAQLEARVLEEVGDGGFTSDDFEIVTCLGRISVQQSGSGAQTAVIAYIARYVARIAYSLPVNTMIKEYLPVAKAVACNELLLLQHLCGIPDDKYQAAVSRPPGRERPVPVVPLLGYFSSAPSEDAAEAAPGSVDDPDAESLWLVYKWEGLRPLGLYMEAGPPEAKATLFKKQEVAEAEAWGRRNDMLRALAARTLAAVDFCHSADVVHGSLSSGSVFMSSSVDSHPDDLVVKLDGFGFGKWYRAPPADGGATQPGSSWPSGFSSAQQALGEGTMGSFGGLLALDSSLEEGKKADLQAAALLLVEAFAAGLAETAAGRLPAAMLKNLLFSVYHEDIVAFRDWCLQEEAGSFSRLVAFLDAEEKSGWDFLSRLLAGKASALELSQHPFLRIRDTA